MIRNNNKVDKKEFRSKSANNISKNENGRPSKDKKRNKFQIKNDLNSVEDRLINQFKINQQKIKQIRDSKTEGMFKPVVYTSSYRSRTPT